VSDKKLTPRVGDRVIAKVHIEGVGMQTRTGSVFEDVTAKWRGEPYFRVRIDGITDDVWQMSASALTVVDRDPVEWPEGWSDDGARGILGPMVYPEPTNTAFTKLMLELVLATGPDMLARWDELVGGGE
jgi:hypothetical protein